MQRSTLAAVLSVLVASLPMYCQKNDSKWQVGTIMSVSEHPKDGEDSVVRKYDVSVKVGDTLYVVLYTRSDGSESITRRVGLEVVVLVGANTMAFNNLLGEKVDVPILSRTTVASK